MGPVAKFGEIFKRVDRRFDLNDDEEYDCVGVRWYGHGAFLRERLSGLQIKRKQQWRIHAEDVVYNKLFAWKGAFAVANETVNGCIVSDKFPTYQPDHDKVDLNYLRWFFRTEQLASQAQRLSKGAAAISKLTLNPPQFWELEIPLPPLEEQRRIVAKIERLAARIEEARRLQKLSEAETIALLGSGLHQLAQLFPKRAHLGRVLAAKPRNGWSARCDNAPDGVPVLTLSAVTGFRYREAEFKRTSLRTDETAHYWLKHGDLLITRSNTPDLVGHAAIYEGSPSPCIYPDLIMRVPVDQTRASTKFIWYWMQTPLVRAFIRSHAKGTSPTMKKISQPVVSGIPFPASLPLQDQHRIVAYLDGLQAKVDRLKALQAQTQAELDALLPSILDRAFKGEL